MGKTREKQMKRERTDALRMVFADGEAFGKLYSGKFVSQETWAKAFAESLARYESNTKRDRKEEVSAAQPAIFED
jgi:hypothetical protein